MARTSPCKLDLFECLRLFEMLWNIITSLVIEPSWSQQSPIWTSFCLDMLAHFFHMDWMEYLGMWCFLPFEILRNGSNSLKHVHLFDLSLSGLSWKQVRSPHDNSLKMQRYMFTFLWQLCKYLTTFRWSFRKTWNLLVSGAIRKCNYMFYGTYPLKR